MQPNLPNNTEPAKTATPLPGFPASPYVGLRPFNSDEALLFFGREQQTIELLQQLHRTHFVGIVGSSGCGKSSLVRAGLIPKLKAGFLVEERDQWLIATLKPGDAPLKHLAEALRDAVGQAAIRNPQSAFEEAIRAGDAEPLFEQLAPALDAAEANLLLLVDQFEELFRFAGFDEKQPHPERRAEADKFAQLLLLLAAQRQLPVYVALTMRSDFLGDCDNFHGLPEALNRSQYLVPRLTREQLRQAVEGPLHLFGASMSPALLERILTDVGDQSDQLPVLQHALMRTWEHWQRRQAAQLDVEDYEAAGTINDALTNDAKAALEGLSEEEKNLTERVFRALTETDASDRVIRCPAHLSELCAITRAPEAEVQKVIKCFQDNGRWFLILNREKDPLVDISQESFIRQWKLIKKWVENEKEAANVYKRLVEDVRLNHELLIGRNLEEAEKWRADTQPNLAWAARYSKNPDDFTAAETFLKQSIAAKWQKSQRAWERPLMGFLVVFILIITIPFLLQPYKQDLSYEQDLSWAKVAYDEKRFADAVKLLASHKANLKLRGTNWEVLNQLCHDEQLTLYGHKKNVRAVTYAPDGKTLASASEDATVKLWDAQSGRELATLKGHADQVWSVAFAPDGKRLASASKDKTVKIWNVQSGREEKTLSGHAEAVLSVAFAPDGRTIVSTSQDKTMRVWDTQAWHVVATLKVRSAILSVAYAPDGKSLASAAVDDTANQWGIRDIMQSWQEPQTLQGHANTVTYAPNGKTLASASENKTVQVWDTKNWREIATLNASASKDKTVKVWDTGNWREIAALKGHTEHVWAVAFAPNGQTLASAGEDGAVKLWDTQSWQERQTLKGHAGNLWSVAYAPDSKTLASASADQTVKIWSAQLSQLAVLKDEHQKGIWAVTYAPDGQKLASAGEDQTVRIWGWDTARKDWQAVTLQEHQGRVWSVAYAPDGKTLASASADQTVKLWDAQSRQASATLQGHEDEVLSVAYAPDGRTLASASLDRTVKVWGWADARKQWEAVTLKGHTNGVLSVAYSPDGKTLASASADRTVKLWDTRSGQELGTLTGHTDRVLSVAYAPDGKTLASASADKTVKVWDARSGQELMTLVGHADTVTSVAYALDGKTLASASRDQTVKLWDGRSGQQLRTLKGHAGDVWSVAYAPDGKTLASAGGNADGNKDFSIRLWHAATDADVARQRNR